MAKLPDMAPKCFDLGPYEIFKARGREFSGSFDEWELFVGPLVDMVGTVTIQCPDGIHHYVAYDSKEAFCIYLTFYEHIVIYFFSK